MANKIFIGVAAKFLPSGEILPREILWEDGRRFEIDKILDVRPAASLKTGGSGLRYTCRIKNREAFLFLDGNRWFVEGKANGR